MNLSLSNSQLQEIVVALGSAQSNEDKLKHTLVHCGKKYVPFTEIKFFLKFMSFAK